ncbi:MAG: hypothetical protein LBK13_09100 [Spirochaetales bacterium]|jgi:hypothetical protein|nr:hypothetical protein [Spirochaetales bacterium]
MKKMNREAEDGQGRRSKKRKEGKKLFRLRGKNSDFLSAVVKLILYCARPGKIR